MHAFQTAASAFCIACICAEITTPVGGRRLGGQMHKAVAGLYILVILFRLAPQMKLEPEKCSGGCSGSGHASRVRRHRLLQGNGRNGWKRIFAQSVSGALVDKGELEITLTRTEQTVRTGQRSFLDPPGVQISAELVSRDRGISAAGAWHGTDTGSNRRTPE